jgi:Pyridoxamine 5'-phosphate oxidase
MENISPSPFSHSELDALLQARVIYVATVRKDGTQSTAAPIWFTVTPERRIVIQSRPGSWHARRVRRGSLVIVWFGKQRALAFIGKAELSTDPMVVEQIIKDYPRKYLMARLGWHRPTKSSFERGARLAIKITPIQALPRGFRSEPGAPAPKLDDVPVNFG